VPEKASIPGFGGGFAKIDGVTLHYWRGGVSGGPPVLLWHGFLGTGYTWHKVAPELAKAGFDVLIPDMRGYGDSDKPSGVAGYDALALSEECRALAKQLSFGQRRPILQVGHDMGAHPALLWVANHPGEVSGLIYAEVPVMLSSIMSNLISYTPEMMRQGSLWWWVLALAPDVPERLIVGREIAFLTWFYERYTARADAINPATVDEYLRTFSGREGVLGAMGVYRAAFTTITQTEPLTRNKIQTPAVAMGGALSLGGFMGTMLQQVALHVSVNEVAQCGHFIPEEAPEAIVDQVCTMVDSH
jgi:pimeloyl-ACP methyl ester carboxylesterase